MIMLWDVETGRRQISIEGHTRAINSVIFSPNGNLLASTGDDGTVRIWDVETGEQQRIYDGFGGTGRMAFNPDGSLLAFGNGTSVVLWDIEAAEQILVIQGHYSYITSIDFSPNGTL